MYRRYTCILYFGLHRVLQLGRVGLRNEGFEGAAAIAEARKPATAAASKAAAPYISRQDRRTLGKSQHTIRVRTYFPSMWTLVRAYRDRLEQTPRVPEREYSLNIIAQYFYRLRDVELCSPDSQQMLTFLYASINVCFLIEHSRPLARSISFAITFHAMVTFFSFMEFYISLSLL